MLKLEEFIILYLDLNEKEQNRLVKVLESDPQQIESPERPVHMPHTA